jgi:hypothetical protein
LVFSALILRSAMARVSKDGRESGCRIHPSRRIADAMLLRMRP